MLEIMTTTGEGTGRTQPMNGLDELLSLPGKAGKATKSPPSHTGNSSFEQILTEDMQSLPRGKAGSLPPAADDKPALGLIIGLAASRDAQTPHAAAKKAVKRNEESLPAAAVDPNILISLLTAAPFGTVPETNTTPTDGGADDKLPPGIAAEKLLLHKIVKQELPPLTARASQAGKETPIVKQGVTIPPLTPVAENITSQGVAVSASVLHELLTPLQSLSGEKLEPGLMAAKEAENILNPATTIIDEQAKISAAEKRAAASPKISGHERVAIITAALQSPTQGIDKPAAEAPPTRTIGIAPSLTSAADKIPHQAAVSAAIIAPPEKATVPGRQAAETATEANVEREAALPKAIPALMTKNCSDEFLASQGDGNKDFVLGDKGKPNAREQFTIPETPETMGVNANRAAPLGKGQDAAAPTPSLLAQVAEQLPEAISKGSGRIRISLEPENLGKLDMDIVIRENKVQIVLTAENRTVQQTLQGNVEQLKDALRQQGLEVNGFNVLLQNGRQGQGDPAGANLFWSGYNHSAAGNKGTGGDGLPTATVPFLPGQNLKNGAEGINIFA